MNNYFKVHTTAVAPIDTIVTFDDESHADTVRAWQVARDMAAHTKAKRIVAWRRPQFLGLWSDAEVLT